MLDVPDDLAQRLRDLLAKRVAKPELVELPLETTLADLGLDSLDKVELLFELETCFNVEIPDAVAARMSSLADVAAFLASAGQPADLGSR